MSKKVDKVKAEQFGVRYPDGRIEWDDGSTFTQLRTTAQRAVFDAERRSLLTKTGVANDPGVTFLHRYRIIYYTAPEAIAP